ncbi:MAG: hypothetical protein ACK51G_00320, partial [Pseudomonadota bacterium]
GKGASARNVPVAPELEALLYENLAARGLPDWHESALDKLLQSAPRLPAARSRPARSTGCCARGSLRSHGP